MKPATPEQKKAINTILAKRKLMAYKADIIAGSTDGRTEHSSELYFDEAQALLKSLNAANERSNSRMMRKLFAMANEIGIVSQQTVATDCGELKIKKDYSRLHNWVNKYGYLKKPINDYTYDELPKLVSQFEFGPYKDYLSNHH